MVVRATLPTQYWSDIDLGPEFCKNLRKIANIDMKRSVNITEIPLYIDLTDQYQEV